MLQVKPHNSYHGENRKFLRILDDLGGTRPSADMPALPVPGDHVVSGA